MQRRVWLLAASCIPFVLAACSEDSESSVERTGGRAGVAGSNGGSTPGGGSSGLGGNAGASAGESAAGDGGSGTLRLPEANAPFDYQLGGAYDPPADVEVLSRDRTDAPAPGLYNVCYVNGFQAQPGDEDFWLEEHPD